MPAFCVSPKMSPLGRSRSISAVSGSFPAGPAPAVRTSHVSSWVPSLVPSFVKVPPTISSKPMLRAGAAMVVSYLPERRRLMRFSITWVTAEKSSLPQPLSSASS